MMNNYCFVSSFYYPIESSPTPVQVDGPISQPVSPAQKAVPMNIRQVVHRVQQIELSKPQQVEQASPVANYYIAPEPETPVEKRELLVSKQKETVKAAELNLVRNIIPE
ncbi:unnamed protein product [Strongylus vulgaris]|uniref:Uncharacterized protein n=1 Tax=Strongylus vulgaris TaxID=40348 RepID=A0A3P7I645_STRVU|nr:unnamed protein product [Strongylus vulgaris]